MLDRSALQRFRPYFLTPCYGGQVAICYTNSMLRLLQAMNNIGMCGGIRIHQGSSLVTRARNEGMIEFLQDRSYTHLFWMDADIGFEPETAFRILLADKEVIAGAYPVKSIHWPEVLPNVTPQEFVLSHLRYPVNAAHRGNAMDLSPDDEGLLEVSEAPTGFMAIKRHVLDKLIAARPDLKYIPDFKPGDPRADYCYRFFDVMVEPETNRYLSEDYAFCRRWRDLGGKVFIDTTAKLEHVGHFSWHGDFATSLRLAPEMACGLPPDDELQYQSSTDRKKVES